MNTMKVVGFIAAGVGLAVIVGGGIWLWRRHKNKESSPQVGPTPSKPPRQDSRTEDEDEDDPAEEGTPKAWQTRGHYVSHDDIDDELLAELEELFPGEYKPTDAIIDGLTQEDVVIVAVESEESGPYENTRQELVQAKVLSIEKTIVRARIQALYANKGETANPRNLE